jgi:hypothetical protein
MSSDCFSEAPESVTYDVWEPSLRKEKPPLQPLNHLDIQPIKRCFIFSSLPISFPLTIISVSGKIKGKMPFLCGYWGNIAAERELLRRQILEVKAKLKNLWPGINKQVCG